MGAPRDVTYSVDTSVLLNAWWRNYPPDLFPTLWRNIESLADNGVMLASEEVLVELQKKDDEVHAWATARAQMFVPIDDEIQQLVGTILERYPRLIDNRPSRGGADPFVIALAAARGYTVLTDERATGNESKPKIPDVCTGMGIAWTNLVGCIREQGWQI